MELSVDDFMGILEEAETLSMRAINLRLSDINYFWIFEEFR
jgi:hypothetical protein